MNKIEIKEVEILKDYKDILTFKELKELLKLGRNKVYELLKNGDIPSTKIGRDYRILKVSVINYLLNQKENLALVNNSWQEYNISKEKARKILGEYNLKSNYYE